MALAHWQSTFTDDEGNIQAGLSVEIRRESNGALAAIFEDIDGNTAKSNPFTTDSFGYGDFYAVSDRYRIQSTDIDWRNVEVLSADKINEVDKRTIYVGSVAELRASEGLSGDVYIQGYYGPGTRGGGSIYADREDTTSEDNGGTVFVDSSGVRWKRPEIDTLYASWFGLTEGQNIAEPMQRIAGAVTSNKKVVFEPGNYTLDLIGEGNTSDNTYFDLVQVDNVEIEGYGAKILVEDLNIDSKSLIIFSFYGCKNIKVKGFDLEMTTVGGTNTVSTRAVLIEFGVAETEMGFIVCENPSVMDCRLRVWNPNGGTPAGSGTGAYAKLIGVYFRGDYRSETNNQFTVRLKGARFINNIFHDTTARTVWLWYVDDCVIDGNSFVNTGSSYVIRALLGNTNVTISNNYFSTRSGGEFSNPPVYFLKQSAIVESFNIKVLGNVFEVDDNTGAIEIRGSDNVIVSGNTAYQSGTGTRREGVRVIDGSSHIPKNAVISNNLFRRFSQGIEECSTNSIIEGNIVSNTTEASIVVRGDGTFVSGNTVQDSDLDSFEIRSSLDGKECRLENNISLRPGRSGVLVSQDQQEITIHGNTFFGGESRTISSVAEVGTPVITNNKFYDNTSGEEIIRDLVNNTDQSVTAWNVARGNTNSGLGSSAGVVQENIIL